MRIRVDARLLPSEAEVHGLVALMELQASRARARIGPGGAPVLLRDQDRSRWDWMLVQRGLDAIERAYATGGPLGPYTLQAGIAACHARARVAEDTDWERIVVLYDGLAQLLLPTVRGDLLEKLGRKAEAGQEFQRAAALTANARERAVLLRRAQ